MKRRVWWVNLPFLLLKHFFGSNPPLSSTQAMSIYDSGGRPWWHSTASAFFRGYNSYIKYTQNFAILTIFKCTIQGQWTTLAILYNYLSKEIFKHFETNAPYLWNSNLPLLNPRKLLTFHLYEFGYSRHFVWVKPCNICPLGTGLFHSASSPQGSSVSWHAVELHSVG